MKEVVYNQKFYYIDSFMVDISFKDCERCLRTSENHGEHSWYYWVIPMYVYQKNTHWDGEKTFDVSPVDFSDGDGKKNWRFKFEAKYSEIGERLFNTEKEAWKAYNDRFDKSRIKIYRKLKKMHDKQKANIK